MKPIEKITFSLSVLAVVTFLVANPLNLTNDNGDVVHVSPLGWLLFGAVAYLLIRSALKAYKEYLNVKQKRTYVRHSRSHYNTTRKGK